MDEIHVLGRKMWMAIFSGGNPALDLVVPTTRLKAYGDRSFKKVAPLVWNSLPLSIRNSRSKSLSEFNWAFKTHRARTTLTLQSIKHI